MHIRKWDGESVSGQPLHGTVVGKVICCWSVQYGFSFTTRNQNETPQYARKAESTLSVEDWPRANIRLKFRGAMPES